MSEVNEKEYMEKIEDLKEEIAYVRRTEITGLKEDIVKVKEVVNEINLNQVRTNDIVEMFSKTQDKTNETMDKMADAIQESSKANALAMQKMSFNISGLSESFVDHKEKTNNDICEINKKIENQEMSKWCFIKNNWIPILSIAMIIGVIVYDVLGKIGL